MRILGSTSPDGPFASTVQVTAGQTVYYEVVAQFAPVGTTCGSKTITSLTDHPAPNAFGYDGFGILSFSLQNAGDFHVTFSAASLASNPSTGDNWNVRPFSSPGSAGLDRLTKVFASQPIGARAAATFPSRRKSRRNRVISHLQPTRSLLRSPHGP